MSHRASQDEATDVNEKFAAALASALSDYGISELGEAQRAQLIRHYAMMRAWNRRINLTRILEPQEAARLHYADSLFGGRYIGAAQAALDIGSGAGFPAVPLAVLRPDITVTALEANQKKSLFLAEAADALGLKNLNVVTARVESFDLSGYDLLASRALDRADTVLPAVLERMREGQRLLLYCAPDLLGKLMAQLAGFDVETHAIPQSEARLVAVFGMRA
jgi:16S rRNA (guanine527-N7)-methyltransferase